VALRSSQRIFEPLPSWVMVGLFCVTPAFAYYALAAQSYMLMLLLAFPFSILAVNIAQDLSQEEQADNNTIKLFAMLGLAMSYAHYYGLFLYIAAGVLLLLLSLRSSDETAKILFSYTFISAMVFLPWALWQYLVVKSVIMSDPSALSAEGNVLAAIEPYFDLLAGGYVWVLGAALPLLVIAFMRGGWAIYRDARFFMPVVVTIALGGIVALACLYSPIVTGRNFLVLVPLHLIFMTYLLTRALGQGFLLGLGALALVVGLCVNALPTLLGNALTHGG